MGVSGNGRAVDSGPQAPRPSPALAVEELEKRFGGVRVLDDIALMLDPGESLGLTGPNGSGKTTLLDIISGFVRADRGRVRMAGRDVTGWAPHRIVRTGAARTFQAPRLAFRMTVEENVRAATLYRRLTPRAGRETVDGVLASVGLEGAQTREVRDLSPGQIRRVELARALATSPRLLLLDEPFAALGPEDVPEALSALRGIRAAGHSLLIVAHSRAVFEALCTRVVVLEGGRIVRTCAPGDLPRA